MKVEHPAAFSFIMQDEIFLLNSDKAAYLAPGASRQPLQETLPISFNYRGGNKKNFLIIVHYPGHALMQDEHFTPLENTLKRLGFEIEDVAIFNLANNPEAKFDELTAYFKPGSLLLLGKNSIPAGMDTPALNKVQPSAQINTLLTFSFGEMMNSNENKKVFWEQMKLL